MKKNCQAKKKIFFRHHDFLESFAYPNFSIWFFSFCLEINETEDVATNEPQKSPPTKEKAGKKRKAEPELKPDSPVPENDKEEKSVAAKKKGGRPKKVAADQQNQNGDSAEEVPAPAKGKFIFK